MILSIWQACWNYTAVFTFGFVESSPNYIVKNSNSLLNTLLIPFFGVAVTNIAQLQGPDYVRLRTTENQVLFISTKYKQGPGN